VGPFVGAPVVYHWPWYRHLPSLGPWLLLALAVALPATNRHRHALLIFVPLLVLGLSWDRVTTWTGMPSASRAQFSFLGEFLAVGIALLWLNADQLGRFPGPGRLAVSLGILLLADLVVTLSYWGTFAGQTGMFIVFTIVVLLLLLLPLTLTRWLAHRRYQPVRFLLWLAIGSTICSIVGAAAFVGVLALTVGYSLRSWAAVVPEIIVPGLVIGLCLCAAHLPYLLLMFSSPFFRRRFRAWLGVEAVSPPAGNM
jgi:hypothetical protein